MAGKENPPGSAELRGEIAQALCCHGECIRGEAACWKYTTSGHKKITDAIVAIFDRLAAKPDEDGVREAQIKLLARFYNRGNESEVAQICDEELDRSGALLGKVRTAARALSFAGVPRT